ncbi:hypothetical protein [Sandaracinus amylolyticus]|uniref:hypothetical protein n=1 Tax=Sandaracinus amylolyticus TaxID=927083 RepID=UPI001F332C68|nr:hypothetical protein [Sandaracinus amylolyticus]UJR83210.1 Hypothetical protein I5071_52760 [Sandaracinus amylolyticus]
MYFTYRGLTSDDEQDFVRLEVSGRRLTVEHRRREIGRVEPFLGDTTLPLGDGRQVRVHGSAPRCIVEVDGERWPRVEAETAPLRSIPAVIVMLTGLAAVGGSVWRGDSWGFAAGAMMGFAAVLILAKRFARIGWALGLVGGVAISIGLMLDGAAAVTWFCAAMNTVFLALWWRTIDDLNRAAAPRA